MVIMMPEATSAHVVRSLPGAIGEREEIVSHISSYKSLPQDKASRK